MSTNVSEAREETISSRFNCSENATTGSGSESTCSNATNCAIYQDCCYDVQPNVTRTQAKKLSCVSVFFDDWTVQDIHVVTGCNRTWPDDEVKEACENTTTHNETFHHILVTGASGVTYRNGFCALCNYDTKNLSYWQATSTDNTTLYFKSRRNHLQTGVRGCNWKRAVNSTCLGNSTQKHRENCEAYFEPVLQSETQVVYKNVYCALCNDVNISSLACMQEDDVTGMTSSNRTSNVGESSSLTFENGTVSKRDTCFSWYNDKCYIPRDDYRYSNDTPLNKTAKASADESYTYTFQHYLVMVCIGISLFFLFLKAVTYVFFGASRSFASRCNLCLSGTLFATQLVYILSGYLDVPDDVCVASSVMLHYGYVATFSWTSVLSFDMWRNIASMRLATRHDRTFAIYCIIAWGAPLVLIAICSALNWGAPWSPLSPAYGQYYCFFGKYRAYVAFFLAPMGVLLLFDVGLYIHIIIYVRRSSHLRGSKSGHQPSDVALFFKLALIMGATWVFGLLTFLNSTVIQVLTSVFTGLQGVYLFFGFKDYQYFCAGTKAKRKEKEKLRASNTSNSSNVSNSTELDSVNGAPAGVPTGVKKSTDSV
ncbi:unnamed protein product [Ixodes hexagonus]